MTTLESDKQLVFRLATTRLYFVICDSYSLECVFAFGEEAGIINSHNYMTVINRLRNALNSLYLDGVCTKEKYGKGHTYNFTKSLKNDK